MATAQSGSAVAITYTSRYGSTARYARALAERIGGTAVDLRRFTPGPGPVVVLAPIYASTLRSRRRVLAALKASEGPAAVALVGISPLDKEERLATAERLLADTADSGAPQVFHLLGTYDPGRLGPVHRAMMAFAKSRLKDSDDPSARAIRSEAVIDLVSEDALDPIVEWVRRISG